jgi:hypothetical protein
VLLYWLLCERLSPIGRKQRSRWPWLLLGKPVVLPLPVACCSATSGFSLIALKLCRCPPPSLAVRRFGATVPGPRRVAIISGPAAGGRRCLRYGTLLKRGFVVRSSWSRSGSFNGLPRPGVARELPVQKPFQSKGEAKSTCSAPARHLLGTCSAPAWHLLRGTTGSLVLVRLLGAPPTGGTHSASQTGATGTSYCLVLVIWN